MMFAIFEENFCSEMQENLSIYFQFIDPFDEMFVF